MSRNNSLDLLHSKLFDPNVELTEHDEKTLDMYRDVYVYWLDKPTFSDRDIRDYIMNNHGRSQTQAYRDIAAVKVLLGNVTSASKEWFRHKINTILDEAYQFAAKGDDCTAKALVKVAEAFTKNNRTDQDDGERIPWEDIVPQVFAPISDPSVVGVKPRPNIREEADRLYRKYVEDIEFTETISVPEGNDGEH